MLSGFMSPEGNSRVRCVAMIENEESDGSGNAGNNKRCRHGKSRFNTRCRDRRNAKRKAAKRHRRKLSRALRRPVDGAGSLRRMMAQAMAKKMAATANSAKAQRQLSSVTAIPP